MKLLLFVFFVCATRVSGLAAVHYVDGGNPTPSAPYTSWATAAPTIQDAVDVSAAGDGIIVTNGLYTTGGRAVAGTMTNRVAVDRAVSLRSVNGPQFTIIQGYQVPGSATGAGAIRCVYLTNGASLSGFTLTNGATGGWEWDPPLFDSSSGGGAWCDVNTVLSNCTILSNSAAFFGGGVQGGTLNNCIVAGNTSNYGGGACNGTLNNCVIRNNMAVDGGGVYACQGSSSLNNCLIVSNNSSSFGGGVSGFSTIGGTISLSNCTIVGNFADEDGGGVWLTNGTLVNCIVYYNTAPYGSNWAGSCLDLEGYCCTTPAFYCGVGNITNEPMFVDLAGGNLRLQSNSPCINAGNNLYAAGRTDFDGNPRIRAGTVDIGAYEFQYGASSIAPQLGITFSGQTITLSWPLWASNFVLQAASGIPANSWAPVGAPVTTTEQENRSSVSLDGSTKFFRLLVP